MQFDGIFINQLSHGSTWNDHLGVGRKKAKWGGNGSVKDSRKRNEEEDYIENGLHKMRYEPVSRVYLSQNPALNYTKDGKTSYNLPSHTLYKEHQRAYNK